MGGGKNNRSFCFVLKLSNDVSCESEQPATENKCSLKRWREGLPGLPDGGAG